MDRETTRTGGAAAADVGRRVELPAGVLGNYRAFSLYNSPYPAHDAGCAIDLYPETNAGRSPVAGEVVEVRTVRAPSKPYAVADDHLIVVDVDVAASSLGGVPDGDGLLARVLHVEPAVEPGDRVDVGDSLGEMVRSGFFAPWVDNHVHLGFRTPEQNPHRASGSLPVSVPAPVALPWDGTGTVVETGETYATLDAPTPSSPSSPETGSDAAPFFGIAADGGGVLDGGLPHYGGGGLLGASPSDAVSLLGTVVGEPSPDHADGDAAATGDRRTLRWRDVRVTADGVDLTGLSLFCARPEAAGAKLVCPGHGFAVGDELSVRIRPGE